MNLRRMKLKRTSRPVFGLIVYKQGRPKQRGHFVLQLVALYILVRSMPNLAKN